MTERTGRPTSTIILEDGDPPLVRGGIPTLLLVQPPPVPHCRLGVDPHRLPDGVGGFCPSSVPTVGPTLPVPIIHDRDVPTVCPSGVVHPVGLPTRNTPEPPLQLPRRGPTVPVVVVTVREASFGVIVLHLLPRVRLLRLLDLVVPRVLNHLYSHCRGLRVPLYL